MPMQWIAPARFYVERVLMDNSGELIKEVYARFGLAYLLSEVLHRGLCTVYALLTFESNEDITRARVEEKFSYAFSLTLGQLIREVEKVLPIELNQRLQIAVEKRNYLAHYFWFERIDLMYRKQGLEMMLLELDEFCELFNNLDDEVTKQLKPRSEEIGVTNEVVQQLMMDLPSGEDEEPLISQRRLKKRERIVRVWVTTQATCSKVAGMKGLPDKAS
jgi:hypothetical protein